MLRRFGKALDETDGGARPALMARAAGEGPRAGRVAAAHPLRLRPPRRQRVHDRRQRGALGREGRDVAFCLVTTGGAGVNEHTPSSEGSIPIREKETRAAARILGV